MNTNQIVLVQQSFAKVEPIAETAAHLFYQRLFQLDPDLKPLFREGDMQRQGRMLMQMLGTAVQGLTRLEKILPAVRALGQRHVGYGVRNEHYDTVGAALLWTLEQGLGAEFTPDVRDAWATAYGLLAGVMQEAAEQSPLAA